MKQCFILNKMKAELSETVQYYLQIDHDYLLLNNFINQSLKIEFTNKIYCAHCGKLTRKSFGHGFCFACYQTAPEADITVMKPELDQSHLGIARDMEWAKTHNLIDHYVYLANTGDLKVGITRHTQIPTRWIDQGATQAVRIAKVPYRQLSGLIEVELKKNYKDITNWRKMLQGEPELIDLNEERKKAQSFIFKNFGDYLIDDAPIEISYPITKYPKKVKSLKLDQQTVYRGKLVGIKGQYLIFDDDIVFNLRSHTGYQIYLEV
ncbi:MAG: DUF2797 domain-containing protein [Bacteroidales bacterium]|nr:DUF2797 domain-containing protein [Bacteroidales bacterium]